jgi:acyl-CoA synthetase (AMP-forming)/AMP-acid ligase II
MQVEAGVLVRTAAQRFGSRVALSDGPRRLTFAELNERANRVGSALLDLGVLRGDRVGVLAYNTAEVVETWFGCEKHNLVRVVLHSHIDAGSHVWSLNDVKASVLIFDSRFTEEVERHRNELKTVRHFVAIGADCPAWATPFGQLESGGTGEDPYLDVNEDAPCFLQLTSGTTGHPKAWIKTYRSWQAVIDHNLHHFDTFGQGVPPIQPDDVNLHFHPIQWASGFQTLYPYYVRGARSVLLDDQAFDPDVLLDTIAREEVTGVFMPGPLLTPVLDAVEARGGFEHRLRRMVVFFGTPDQLDRTTRLLGPIWAHGSARPSRARSQRVSCPTRSPSAGSGLRALAGRDRRSWKSRSSTITGRGLARGRQARSSCAARCPSASTGECRSAMRSRSSRATGTVPTTSGFSMRMASSTTPTGLGIGSQRRRARCIRTS